ncbi:site-specific integrase [uncultured Acetatifactor sp.]|uniref:tyrosine-type recombinase/integrase n=1 Tax=uncultured Acetatifactor sp. TaxID=1671927 RepID=UPI00261DF998|nr:site-specific integrase [uncultured Acetatifactor sp.]
MARGENVFQRKDGRYEARYIKGRRADGRPLYGFCYGRTYEEAKDKADRARERIERTEPAAQKAKPGQRPDMACFCDRWLSANSARLKPSSRAKYRTDIENHIKPFFGEKLPGEILPEEIDGFTQSLLTGKGLSPKTVRSILTLFHSILSYTGKRSGGKLPDMEITYPKSFRKNTRVLDEKEESALVQLLAQEMDACKFGVYLALRTGMRIGEICALRWCDISFEAAAISVCHTALRLPRGNVCQADPDRPSAAAGDDGGALALSRTELVIGTPKSESSLRLIPLMPDIATLCERFRPEEPEAFLLTGTDRCMDPRKLQRHLKKYLEECGIPEAHFHTLRHTFATRCVEAGFDVKTLSEILGHSNIGITMNLYVHPNLDLKRENMNRLKSLFPL